MGRLSGKFVNPQDCKMVFFPENYGAIGNAGSLYGFRFKVNTIDHVGFTVSVYRRLMFGRENKIVAMDTQSGNGFMISEDMLAFKRRKEYFFKNP